MRAHERSLQRLLDAYEPGAIDLAELTMRSERVRARMATARDDLAALERVLAEQRELKLVITRVEEFAARVRDGLDALSWQERRDVVRTLVARIEIDDDDVSIVYRVPATEPATRPVPPPQSKCRLRPGRQDAGVAGGVKAGRGHRRGQPAEKREGIHVDGDGAVCEGLLERDATRFVIPDRGDQAVGPQRDALLGDGGPEDVPRRALPRVVL